MPEKLRPSRGWYGLAALIGVVGVVTGVLLFVDTFTTIAGDIDRFTTSESGRVTLEEGEARTIYVQTRGSGAGAFDLDTSSVSCGVAGPGGPVDVESTVGELTLTRGDDEYKALYDFEASSAGLYAVACRTAGPGAQSIPLAIGPHLGVIGLVGRILGGLAAFFGGLLIAIGIAVLVAVLRHRNKKRMRQPGVAAGLGG